MVIVLYPSKQKARISGIEFDANGEARYEDDADGIRVAELYNLRYVTVEIPEPEEP